MTALARPAAAAAAVVLSIVAGPPVASARQAREAPGEIRPPVERLLRTGNFHGIPWSSARSLRQVDVEPLRRTLDDPAQKPYWRNAVWMLGVIAEPEAVETLIAFQERHRGEVDADAFQALLQVNQALGLAARRPGSRAFAYLRDGTTPEAWGARVDWVYPGVGPRERDLLLLKLAINGLGLAGTAEARQALEALARGFDPQTLRICRANLEEARERNAEIAEVGHDEYFRRRTDGETP